MEVSYRQAYESLKRYLRAQLVPMLLGSPGIGKSGLAHQLAAEYNLQLIDLRLAQCDPTDLAGFPSLEGGRADYLPMRHFPIKGDPLPPGKDGWLLLLDEITSAPAAIQAASYKLILDRMVGSHPLHERCLMMAAGNRETDGAIVETMSTALQSRLVHLDLTVDMDQWIDWATEHQIDHRITDFVKFKPDQLYTFRADHTDHTYACPRTWEFANRLMTDQDLFDPIMVPVLSGTISEGVAREFITFCRIYQDLPTIPQIMARPKELVVPEEPSILFALTGTLAHHINTTNATALMQFIDRLPMEFQVVCLRETVRRHRELISHVALQSWIQRWARELF